MTTIGDIYDSLPETDKRIIAGVINGDIPYKVYLEFSKDPTFWRHLLEGRGRKMTREEQLKIFFNNAPIFEIKRFCEENGYCLVIESPDNFWIEKEHGR